MIPVSIITGFLGSGKTTLLSRLLRDPAMNRTAVIINEFGEVGLDHDLVETSDESFVQLSNGCLCCTVRSDLVLTLSDLAARRAAGTLPPFDRVIVETTGLADPAPILHALMTDRAINEAFSLDSVITTVDAVTGLSTLAAHAEGLRQAAVADRMIVTKTDIEPRIEALVERLRAINPTASIVGVEHGQVAVEELFGARDSNGFLIARLPPSGMTYINPSFPRQAGTHAQRHLEGITSFCIVRDEPIGAVALALFLSGLAENCGPDLLRMKGIVNVREDPQRPAVIHGVQHVYHAPVWLPRWPSDDRRTRMVFIGQHISERWVRGLLDLLEDEVAEETGRRALRLS